MHRISSRRTACFAQTGSSRLLTLVRGRQRSIGLFRKRFEGSSSLFCFTLGLAGFSHKLDKDPWNQEKNLNGKGILCAHLEGGTVTYMCPEQLWVISESKKIDKAADQPLYLALKDRWQITPATSDMSQAEGCGAWRVDVRRRDA